MMQAKLFRDPFHRKWCVGIDSSKTCLTRLADACFQRIRIIELSQESIEEAARLHSIPTSGLSMICFISKTEIIGSTRMKMKNNMRKSAIGPRKVEMSQMVGEYIHTQPG